jgi:2-isopropylmalate synthase
MLKHSGTYEIMTPESVGLNRSTLVMGKHSGRHAFKAKLAELGYADLSDNAIQDAFLRFKDLADHKKDVYDEDILALVDDAVVRRNDQIRFVSLQVVCGSKGPQTAELELEVEGETKFAKAEGNGPVDALFAAINAIYPHQTKLQLYQVHAVTEGTDAQAEVTVRLEENGRTVNGQGADHDTLVASARAYVNALNKLLVKREKTAPAAMSA